MINSLVPGRWPKKQGKIFFNVKFSKYISWYTCTYESCLKSTMVQVMAWCCKATSHNLSQCWPMSVSTYGISSPQWDKVVKKVHEMPCTYDQAIFHPCSVMNPRNSLWITIIINIQKNPFFLIPMNILNNTPFAIWRKFCVIKLKFCIVVTPVRVIKVYFYRKYNEMFIKFNINVWDPIPLHIKNMLS